MMELVDSTPIDKITVAQVADVAGVHETSIYRRWHTREGMLLDAIRSNASTVVPVPDTGSFAGDLLALQESLLARLNTRQGSALARMSVATSGSDPRGSTIRAGYWVDQRRRLEVIAVRACERGEVPDVETGRIMIEMAAAPIYFRRLVTNEPADRTFLERTVATLLGTD